MAVSTHALEGGFLEAHPSNRAQSQEEDRRGLHSTMVLLFLVPNFLPEAISECSRPPWQLLNGSIFCYEVFWNPHIHPEFTASLFGLPGHLVCPVWEHEMVLGMVICLLGCLTIPENSSGTSTVFKLSLTPVTLHRPVT